LPDPAPKPCGGAKEGVVYGFVSLPPGGTHRERWLLNQWARLSEPGRYFVRAERHLPLLGFDPVTEELSKKPLAFALAINELSFELKPATEDELQPLLEPYLKAFDDPARGTSDLSEPVLVATALPKPYFLDRLVRLARPSPDEHRWDARRGLEGLARLRMLLIAGGFFLLFVAIGLIPRILFGKPDTGTNKAIRGSSRRSYPCSQARPKKSAATSCARLAFSTARARTRRCSNASTPRSQATASTPFWA